jgi:hypothetical protein
LERDELLKEVSQLLGYQRLGSKVEEILLENLRRILASTNCVFVRVGRTESSRLVRAIRGCSLPTEA